MIPVLIEKTLGAWLYNFKGRDDSLLVNLPKLKSTPNNIEVFSEEFEDGQTMPLITTQDGEEKSPSLQWKLKEPLTGLSSFALVVQDPDAPLPSAIVHLLAYDIPAETTGFKLGLFDKKAKEIGFKFGYGAFNRIGYAGPRPVLNHGPHRYIFQVFALNEAATKKVSSFEGKINLTSLSDLVEGNVLGYGKLTGVYERKA